MLIIDNMRGCIQMGHKNSGIEVDCLAFADEIVVLSELLEGAQNRL